MSGSGKSGIVDEWRKQHLDELDKTLAVLISIRDDTGEESKNRIDASKAIARMFGGLAPERSGKEKLTGSRPEMDDKLRRELDMYLNDL